MTFLSMLGLTIIISVFVYYLQMDYESMFDREKE